MSSRRTSRHYYKVQTRYARVPAMLEAHRHSEAVGVCIRPEHSPGECRDPAIIFLTANEAKAFAAWVAEQADHLSAKAARAAARRAARLAAKGPQT